MGQAARKPFFVFELANNHMGLVDLGLRIIREVAAVSAAFRPDFEFGFKVQFRDLDTFIHPRFRGRIDLKYVKRFSETRLDWEQFRVLKDEMVRHGFTTVCTPFDEASVGKIESLGFDVIKVASCSFTDWPLLERIAASDRPVIASAAGVALQDIDNVVSFFDHRDRPLALLHCVAEYPTQDPNLQLNQIDLFRQRYCKARIGYSTHEDPDNTRAIQMAIAKGATIFEKHVGVRGEGIALNDYSATPAQVGRWLQAARDAFAVCGAVEGRCSFTESESASLRSLRRGVFARRGIGKGERVSPSDVFLAFPATTGQVTANDLSKYSEFFAETDLEPNQPLLWSGARVVNHRDHVYQILRAVKKLLRKCTVALPKRLDFEISHHYGLDRFEEFGATIINCFNREYCKKLIVLLPGQTHPEQHHKIKEETFHILHGAIRLTLDGEERSLGAGDIVTVDRGVRHAFGSKSGAVIEEISSKHQADDSYYSDPAVTSNVSRKTRITYWID